MNEYPLNTQNFLPNSKPTPSYVVAGNFTYNLLHVDSGPKLVGFGCNMATLKSKCSFKSTEVYTTNVLSILGPQYLRQ